MIIVAMLAAIVMSLQQAPPRDTRPPSNTTTGRIIGVVTTDDSQRRPLRRARVAINGPSLSTGWSVITDDDGGFEFAGLVPGRYTVDALKDGYVPVAFGAPRPRRPGRSVNVAEGQTVTLSLQLPRGAVITGTVIDVDGQPAPGIRVMVLSRRFAAGASGDYVYPAVGVPPISTTDDHGVYRVFGLPAGDYLVSARPNPGAVPISPGVSGVQVQMMTNGTLSSRRMLLTAVYHPGVTDISRAERVSVGAGEERSGIDVQLDYVPIAMVSGTMPSPPGYGPARVSLWRTDGTGGLTAAVAAYDQGRFQFASVPPGQYRITAVSMSSSQTDGGAAPPDTQFAVADVIVTGEDLNVPLSPRPSLSISGQVVFNSQASAPADLPPGLRINSLTAGMTPANGGFFLPTVTLDGTRFRMDGVVPGLYRALSGMQGLRAPIGTWWLTSLAAGGRELLDAPFDIEDNISDLVATFSDRASALSVTVRDAQGAPASDPWIIVFPVDRRFWFVGSRRIVAVKPNTRGAWTIRNLPPGDYRAVASLDVDQNEWFDPDTLQRLLPSAAAVTISGTDPRTLDLIIR